MENNEYTAMNGTKLEYSEDGKSYTALHGITSFPDLGGEPNSIDTTSLDNETFETAIDGLIPAQSLQYEFNCQEPSNTANINLASNLEDTKKTYHWKITYSNGIVYKYDSKVRTVMKGGSSGDLIKFTMYHKPSTELVREIPTTTVSENTGA